MPTAPANGCRSFSARQGSRRSPASSRRHDVLIDARLRGRPARRHAHGPARGRSAEPSPTAGSTSSSTNNDQAESGPDRQGEPACRKRCSAISSSSTPPRRRPRGRELHLGNPGSLRRPARSLAAGSTPWNPATSNNGWFACPDNAASTMQARLWIATDQGDNWLRTGRADGLYGSRPTASGAAPRSCSSAARSAPSCADHASRRTGRRCSSPCSTRPPMAPEPLYGFERLLDLRRPLRRVGRISIARIGRRGPRSSFITKIGGGKIA